MVVSRGTPLRAADPRSIGAHVLDSVLGSGGMGRVYLAHSLDGRSVAVKIIHEHLARDERYLARFQREARIACSVAPFCTAEVLDFGVFDGRPYIVTEFLDGPTLASAVDEHGPLSTTDLHQLAVAIAAALTSIHSAGLVHRDIKPDNVLLSKTGPRVIDFGVALSLESGSLLTGASDTVGTPAFMAPEQATHETTTAAADVFAWGGVVAFAGTGKPPFGVAAIPVVMHRVVYDEPGLDGLDPRLLPLVRAAMSKDPAGRPSAAELLGELTGSTTRPMAEVLAARSLAEESAQESRAATPVLTVAGLGPPAEPPPAASLASLRSAAVQPAGPQRHRGTGRHGTDRRGMARRRAAAAAAATAATLGVASVALAVVHHPTGSDRVAPPPAVASGAASTATAMAPAAPGAPGGTPTVVGVPPQPTTGGTASDASSPQASGVVAVTTPAPAGASLQPPADPSRAQYWIGVLATLDQARVAAYETVDVSLLAGVYTAGSNARADDEAAIRSMAAIGGHGQGGRQVIEAVTVLTETSSIAVLHFRSHMTPFAIVGASGGVLNRQPATSSVVQEINLVGTPDGWRVSQVTPV
ncbi:serine/threonine protein kinase [Frankia sp. Mgl5]|uniref:serine/threonine-protein kinase n=1 Tax=Frankia sp. Mgl5 TaxID=2933793 RepID=UPI00200DCDA8|nr:serine/threonine-protein kinase [Frankia sp. Mgl5]MCK9930276.1 serine/threonine protein kinase [Frankia sp. Mgl5]